MLGHVHCPDVLIRCPILNRVSPYTPCRSRIPSCWPGQVYSCPNLYTAVVPDDYNYCVSMCTVQMNIWCPLHVTHQ